MEESVSIDQPTVVPLGPVHSDARRDITEVVHQLSDGGCCRISVITVSDTATDALRLGDHYHPGDETFVCLDGGAVLYTAPADDLTRIYAQTIEKDQSVNIRAGIVHTFVCDAGTVLQSIANTPFTEDWIILAKLTLPA